MEQTMYWYESVYGEMLERAILAAFTGIIARGNYGSIERAAELSVQNGAALIQTLRKSETFLEQSTL
jgi:hypothetical protein